MYNNQTGDIFLFLVVDVTPTAYQIIIDLKKLNYNVL